MNARMNTELQRRRQLGEFLKTRRRQLTLQKLGLPSVPGRSPGLRREEVAVLSGMSVTWYTWLEQGREIQPSRQVLDAIARTLRLTVAEHSYVLSLAGYSGPHAAKDRIPRTAPEHVLRLLDALADLPAYVIAPDWQFLAWSSAFASLYPNVATVPEADRNLLWLMFTDPSLRSMWPDYESIILRFLAEFRADAGPRLADPPFSRLVGRLLEVSPTFRAAWEIHDVGGFNSRERLIHHTVGELRLERSRVVFSDRTDLQMVILTPVPATGTAARLRQMVDAEPPYGLEAD
jgi:transcriptional regulator with XRE-family HTH domain